ncbi:MAG: hypothetical protein R3C52_06090 [Hyphomonadaceae bacterium]
MAGTMTLRLRLALAGAVLTASLAGAMVGAHLGVVDLGAGDMKIVIGRQAERGLVVGVAPRTCPPRCGFDINWRPFAR